jgi:inner membrane protein
VTAPTHIVFGIFFYFIVIAMIQGTMTFLGVGFVVLGTLLPDIDTPKSFLGRILFFISHFIESKFGHRTITHSFLFVIFLWIVTYSLNHWLHFDIIMPLLIGVISHIFLDSSNKQGPCLLYPASIKCVFPGNKQYRIEVNSQSEWVFFFIMCFLVLLTYPIAQRGLTKTLHYLMADIQSAVVDYQEYSLTHEVFAKVEGADNLTNKKIQGTFEVIGSQGKNVLILKYNEFGRLKTIGEYEDNNLRPLKVRIFKGEKLNYVIQQIELEYCTLSRLQDYLNDEYSQYIFGSIEPLEKINLFKNLEFYSPISVKAGNIVLNYATYKDLMNNDLTNVYVKKAEIIIKTRLKNNQVYKPQKIVDEKQVEGSFIDKYEVVLTIEDKEEILVKKGDTVQKGQILAKINRKYNDVKVKDVELKELRKKLEETVSNTDVYSKEIRLKNLKYQLMNIEKNKIQNIQLLQDQIKILEVEEKQQKKKFNKLAVLKIKYDIEQKKKELQELIKNENIGVNDLQLKEYTIKDEIDLLNKEILTLKLHKEQEKHRLNAEIQRKEVDKLDLINRANIKSPISGKVVSIDFTMSIEYLIRAYITILEGRE